MSQAPASKLPRHALGSSMRNNACLPVFSWACCVSLFVYGFFQRTSPSAYYSDLETEFGLDGAGIGSLSSAYFYAYAIAQIPYGIAMDKYGPLIVVCMCSLFTFAAALLFCSQLRDPPLCSADLEKRPCKKARARRMACKPTEIP